jgi:tRNA A37 methylthiotransferase MiaB
MTEALAGVGHRIVASEGDADAHRTFVGEEVDVLVTEPGRGATVLARTPEYRQVVLSGPLPLGEFVRVRIEEARATDLRGRCVGEPTERSPEPSPFGDPGFSGSS